MSNVCQIISYLTDLSVKCVPQGFDSLSMQVFMLRNLPLLRFTNIKLVMHFACFNSVFILMVTYFNYLVTEGNIFRLLCVKYYQNPCMRTYRDLPRKHTRWQQGCHQFFTATLWTSQRKSQQTNFGPPLIYGKYQIKWYFFLFFTSLKLINKGFGPFSPSMEQYLCLK